MPKVTAHLLSCFVKLIPKINEISEKLNVGTLIIENINN